MRKRKKRSEAYFTLKSKVFWYIFLKYRCTFYKVLNYQLSVTGGSSFVQRTQILSTFFRGFLLFILSFIFVFRHCGFLELILRKHSFLCFLACRSAYSGIGSVCCWLYWKKGLSSNKTLFGRLKRKLLRLPSH